MTVRKIILAVSVLLLQSAFIQGDDSPREYQAFDCSNNNLKHPSYGTPGQTALQIGKPNYADNVGAIIMEPNPRKVSLRLGQLETAAKPVSLNYRNINELHALWGQFITHDMFLLHENDAGAEVVNIPLNNGIADPWHSVEANNAKTLGFGRSGYRILNETGARAPINKNTAYLDGSVVYGNKQRADALRTFVGGRLKMTDDGLPSMQGTNPPLFMGHENIRQADGLPPLCPLARLRNAGDHNANVGAEMLMGQTLFVREHNRLADEFASQHPDWDDEKIFQESRRMVIAFLQRITDREYIPALLGNPLPSYKGYNEDINPQPTNFFASAAFRYGHSELNKNILRLDRNYLTAPQGHLPRREEFFNPDLVFQAGPDALFRGMASQAMREVSPIYIEDFRNFMFGNPGGTVGVDLTVIDIMRARDHGVPFYNDCRRFFNLTPHADFKFLNNTDLENAMVELYGTPDRADAYVVGLAEPVVPGSSLGELFYAAIVDHFVRIRDGDRFWYANPGVFTENELAIVEDTRLSTLVMRNFPNITQFPYAGMFDSTPKLLKKLAANMTIFPMNTTSYFYSQKLQDEVQVSWNVAEDKSYVEFLVQVDTEDGWVGIGFAPASSYRIGQGMAGADVTIATFANGTAHVHDYIVGTFGNPVLDTSVGGKDDIFDVEFFLQSKMSILKFKKPFDSNDPNDIQFKSDELVTMLYAWGPGYTVPSYHGPNRGLADLYIHREISEFGNRGLMSALIALSVLTLILMALLFSLIVHKRNHVAIRSSGWKMSLMKLIGIFFCLLSVMTASFSGLAPNPSLCNTARFLFPVGFSTAMGAVFWTQVRIYRIFHNSALSFKAASDNQLIAYTIGAAVINAIIVGSGLASGPSYIKRTMLTEVMRYTTCVSNVSQGVEIVLYIYNGFLLLSCAYLAFKTRKVHGAFNESKSIGLATYNTTIVAVLISLVKAISPMEDNSKMVLSSIAVIYCCLFFVAVIFGHKVYQAMQKPKNPEKNKGGSSAYHRATHRASQIKSDMGSPSSSPDASSKKVRKERIQVTSDNYLWERGTIYLVPEIGVVFIEVESGMCYAFPAKATAIVSNHNGRPTQLELKSNRLAVTAEFSSEGVRQMWLGEIRGLIDQYSVAAMARESQTASPTLHSAIRSI